MRVAYPKRNDLIRCCLDARPCGPPRLYLVILMGPHLELHAHAAFRARSWRFADRAQVSGYKWPGISMAYRNQRWRGLQARPFQGATPRRAAAAREMAPGSSLTDVLERAVRIGVEVIDACDMAGISVARRGRIRTVAAGNDLLRMIDDLQFQLCGGPCYDVLSCQDAVTAHDLATDQRWPRWGKLVSERTGVHASMSHRLFANGDCLGALNMYSTKLGGFAHDHVAQGYVLAAHAAVAVDDNRHVQAADLGAGQPDRDRTGHPDLDGAVPPRPRDRVRGSAADLSEQQHQDRRARTRPGPARQAAGRGSDRVVEPAGRVRAVDGKRFGELVPRVEVEPGTPRTTEEYADGLPRGDLLQVAEVHVLVVTTKVAPPILHADPYPAKRALMPPSVRTHAGDRMHRGSRQGLRQH
jgi:GAF domain-containing protein